MALRTAFNLKGDRIAILEAELRKLNAQASSLVVDIQQLEARERDAESGAEIGAAMNDRLAAQNRLRKLDARIADVREQLAAATAVARNKLCDELVADIPVAARDFLVKARAAQKALVRVFAARDAILAAGFRREHDACPVPPAINGAALLNPDLLDAFEVAISGQRAQRLQPVEPSAPQRVKPPPPLTTTQGAVNLAYEEPPGPPRRALHRETASEGESLFAIFRPGVELARKGQLLNGDVISLTEDEALPLLRAGAGDYITADQVARVVAGDAAQTLRFEGEPV